MASIGKLSVQIAADALPLVKGLADADRALKGSNAKTLAEAKKLAKEQEKIAKDQQKREDQARKLYEKKNLETWNKWNSRAWKAVGFATAGVAGAGFAAASGISSILEDANQAAQLGMSIDDLRASMVLAGPAAGAMAKGLAHMQLTLAQSRAGVLDAERIFGNLSALGGVNVRQEGGLGALEDIAENLSRIVNPSVRAAQAFRVLGESAAELLPILQGGAAAVREAGGMAERFGLAVNSTELQTVREVARVMSDIKMAAKGLLNQVTLAVAPLAAELLTLVGGFRANFSSVRDTILEWLEKISLGLTYLYTQFSDTDKIARAWEGLFQIFRGGITALRAELQLTYSTFLRQISSSAADSWAQLAERTRQAGITRANRGLGILGALAADVRNSPAAQAVEKFFEGVRDRIEDVGQTARDNNPAAFWTQSLQQFDQQAQGLRSMLEGWRDQLNQFKQFQGLGLFEGATGLQAQSALQLARNLIDKGLPQARLAGAATAGSREAYSAIVTHERQAQRGDMQQQIAAGIAEGNRLHNEELRIGQEALRALERLGLVQPRDL